MKLTPSDIARIERELGNLLGVDLSGAGAGTSTSTGPARRSAPPVPDSVRSALIDSGREFIARMNRMVDAGGYERSPAIGELESIVVQAVLAEKGLTPVEAAGTVTDPKAQAAILVESMKLTLEVALADAASILVEFDKFVDLDGPAMDFGEVRVPTRLLEGLGLVRKAKAEPETETAKTTAPR